MTDLVNAWCAETSADPDHWTRENAAWGQCGVTALFVQDVLGGTLLRTTVGGISHVGGGLFDLTLGQFQGGWYDAEPEPREREYVLSFPETVRRYDLLRSRIDSLWAVGE